MLAMGIDEVFRVSAVAPGGDDQQASDWILALAGGEGTRLQDYIRRRFGWQLPKQYCPLLGSRSTLQDTLVRLNHLTPASRTLTVIGPTHAPYAMPQLASVSDHVFRQPGSRGTGLALYVALAMIRRWNPSAVVTVTPTDHHVEPNARYLQMCSNGSNKVSSRSRSTASRGAIAGIPRASRPCSRGTVLELRCRRRARSHDTGAIDDVISSRAEHARGASCAKQVANQDSDVVVMHHRPSTVPIPSMGTM